jgi:hypothetical protein
MPGDEVRHPPLMAQPALMVQPYLMVQAGPRRGRG